MKPCVLIVDDFTNIREMLGDTLRRHGYQTVLAKDGEEAFTILQGGETSIDLVLSDYNMPNMNGYELLKLIKSTPVLAPTPVAFLTTERDIDKMRQAKEAGLVAWIRKPYQLQQFLDELQYIIYGKKATNHA